MSLLNLNKLMQAAHDELKKETLNEKRLQSAYAKILYLLSELPHHHFPMYLLGAYYSKCEQHGAAMLAYEHVVSLYPDFSEAWNNLGGAYRKLNLQQKAVEAFSKAVEIGKTEKFKNDAKENWRLIMGDYVGNLGSAFVAMNQSQKAEKILDEALEINPESGNAKWNRSLVYLEQGRYEEGFRDYEFGERKTQKLHRNYTPGKANTTPLWEGEKDKTVVVYGEQGIGDELMFATILPDMVKDCKKLIYDAHPRLYKMFRRSFKGIGIDCFGTRKEQELHWAFNYKIDARIPIGSIPKFYRKKLEDFPRIPYLIADPIKESYIKEKLEKLPRRLNIGISWKGGTKASSKNVRCMKLEQFLPLMSTVDANYISLQYQDTAQYEVDRFNEQYQLDIIHWNRDLTDYEATLALVRQLDIVISVPQSVVHLCGAAGVKTIQLCPFRHLWQMGVYGRDMPWYNCVTNIWQAQDGKWEACIEGAIKIVKGEFGC